MTQLSLRTPEVIAIEIISIRDHVQRTAIHGAIEIGRKLTEAKKMLPHGAFGDWLADHVGFSQSQANNMMAIFDGYGSQQLDMFGENLKSQTFENLTPTQALALLGVPEEEREAFVVDQKVEEMSTRELQEAVKDRKQAIKEKEAAEKAAAKAEKAAEQERKAREKLETQQKDHAAIVQRLQEQLDTAQAASAAGDEGAAAEAEEAAEQLRASLSKSDEQLIESQKRVKELEEALKAKPVEVATATETVFETSPEVLAELEALRKKAASATGEDTAMFKVHVKSLQDSFNAVIGVITTLKGKDTEVSDKCGTILVGAIERMQKMLVVVTQKASE
ncbi:DUF3102 domain-containing protein [Paenibacillus odorifer]|uniref:DUF3102 domain-containing protein n=1 Tax=Paenibacillus TaxID=44249 RepID=UPI00096C28E1|nr:DUF3102 domain-containing protein [Paenibacillus odorifer]OMC93807.1 hypothetical protein BJP46_30835 [Paenibacillus odorifer]